MSKSQEELAGVLVAQLTSSEQSCSVAYMCKRIFARGEVLTLPQVTAAVPWEAQLAFIDRDPTANWGHACRYVLVRKETGDILSYEARFPPFNNIGAENWWIAYRAPGIPDRFLSIPEK